MGFRLLLLKVIADGANMSESGLKLDPYYLQSLKDHNQRLTNYMVAKTAREKRRKVIADKRARRCKAYVSNVVFPVKEPMVTQLAREKRRQILAAKKAMRCSTTSNVALSNNVQSSQQTKSKRDKTSRSNGEKVQHEAREVPGQKLQGDNPFTDVEKE